MRCSVRSLQTHLSPGKIFELNLPAALTLQTQSSVPDPRTRTRVIAPGDAGGVEKSTTPTTSLEDQTKLV